MGAIKQILLIPKSESGKATSHLMALDEYGKLWCSEGYDVETDKDIEWYYLPGQQT